MKCQIKDGKYTYFKITFQASFNISYETVSFQITHNTSRLYFYAVLLPESPEAIITISNTGKVVETSFVIYVKKKQKDYSFIVQSPHPLRHYNEQQNRSKMIWAKTTFKLKWSLGSRETYARNFETKQPATTVILFARLQCFMVSFCICFF